MSQINHNCHIVEGFARPAAELIGRLERIPVANICDCMNRMASIGPAIRPYSVPRLCGPAFTVKVPYGDNLMVHKASEMIQPGDILVVQCEESGNRAILGSLLVHSLRKSGAAGIIVDGAIRDSEEIGAMKDFPVYARCASPNGPFKNGPGEINCAVQIGGVIVRPGDILCGDSDGIVVLPSQDAEVIAMKSEQVIKTEEEILRKILADEFERPWIDEKLKALGCTYQER